MAGFLSYTIYSDRKQRYWTCTHEGCSPGTSNHTVSYRFPVSRALDHGTAEKCAVIHKELLNKLVQATPICSLLLLIIIITKNATLRTAAHARADAPLALLHNELLYFHGRWKMWCFSRYLSLSAAD